MFKHLLIILNRNSTSFCHYSNSQEEDLIDYNNLLNTINYCKENKIVVNFLLNENILPSDYSKIIESIDHIKMVPLSGHVNNPASIIVINPNEIELISQIKTIDNYIVLRIHKEQLPKLSKIILSLLGKFKKLNLVLLDIENYTNQNIEEYYSQINSIKPNLIKELKFHKTTGLNFITDLWFLSKMNNCEAGVLHITLAPNSKFYICPGFYYNNPENDIGLNLTEINIKNSELLSLNKSPICRICDAYHCRRCVYLNMKTTLEINTPSFQQCNLAHYERKFSNEVLKILKSQNSFKHLSLKPKIDYLDPLTILDNQNYYENTKA